MAKKRGKTTIGDIKVSLSKNLNVWKPSEMIKNNIDLFDQNWKIFIDTLKADKDTKNIWYKL